MQKMIVRVEHAVKRAMGAQDAAHDWPHIERVRCWALRIAHAESTRQPVNKIIVELAALTHDVGDRKAHKTKTAGDRALRKLLSACGVPKEMCGSVFDIAQNVSFKGPGV